MIQLIVGKSDYFTEYSSTQIPSGFRTDAGRQKSDQNTGDHSKKCKRDHLATCHKHILQLDLIDIHPKILICGFHISDPSLFHDHIRHIRHLCANFLHHLRHLFRRHHRKYIKNRRIFRQHSLRDLPHDLFFYLFCFFTARLKTGSHHHRKPHDLTEFFHLFLIFKDRFFQHIRLFFIQIPILFICVLHNFFLCLFRNKQKHFVHFFHGNCFGNRLVNSALLDSDIYNIRSICRQGQVAVCLDKQYGKDRQH